MEKENESDNQGIAEAPALDRANKPRRIMEVSEEEFDQAWRAQGREVRAVARELGVSRQSVYRKVAVSENYRLASEVTEAELLRAMRLCNDDPLAMAQLLEVSTSGLKARLRQGNADLKG